jgi:hypothetical protein
MMNIQCSFPAREINHAILMLVTTGRSVNQAGAEVRNIFGLLRARGMLRKGSFVESLRAIHDEPEMIQGELSRVEYLSNLFGFDAGAAHFLINNLDQFERIP